MQLVTDQRWQAKARELYRRHQQVIYRQTDYLFAGLLAVQWVVCVGIAVWVTPLTWNGTASSTHPHVWAALILGGLITGVPIALSRWAPGDFWTRHAIAIGQAFTSALLIHLTCGRAESHFHIFGSLALLAFYRDWRVLITASIVIAADHFLRGMFWPMSVFGSTEVTLWRSVEHTAWVVFEDIFLIFSCVRWQREMWQIATRQAELLTLYAGIEQQVQQRTRELELRTNSLVGSENRSRRQASLLRWIRQLQADFIAGNSLDELFDRILENTLTLTDSQFGFVGEIHHTNEGRPYLHILAISDITWNAEARRLYAAKAGDGFVFDNLKTLFGAVLTTREFVIANDPVRDPRAGGLPVGHPELTAFLGLPLIRGDEMVGMIGLSNRPGGYDENLVTEMEPMCVTFAQLITAARNEKRRVAAENTLQQTYGDLLAERSRVKAYAEELEAKNHLLDEERRRSDVANSTKSEFLANMSHELRTPMTAILGFADCLLEQNDNDNAREERIDAIRTIQRNGEHLLSIINDILDLSKIEAGKLLVECVPCSPAALLEDVMSMMRVRASRKLLALHLQHETELPENIVSDPTRLRQILVNLVGNAVKFTNSGSVTLVTRLIDGEVPRFECDVIDTGIGLTTEQRQVLFQPFIQGDSSMSRHFGGTGLGLTISKRLAGMLGGDVWIVVSSPGEGTRFRMSISAGIPAKSLTPQTREHDLSPPAKGRVIPNPLVPVPLPLSGCRILLAEDGPDNQRLIAFILRKAGASISIVENGRLAVDEVFRATDNGEPYDLILMDMQMPVMDGYEATALLRAKGYCGSVVALTAHAMSGDREKCLAAGCDDYVAKPVDRNRLFATLQTNWRRSLAMNATRS